MKISTLCIISILLLFFSGVSTAAPLPYHVTDSGVLEVDGNYYWENGI